MARIMLSSQQIGTFTDSASHKSSFNGGVVDMILFTLKQTKLEQTVKDAEGYSPISPGEVSFTSV